RGAFVGNVHDAAPIAGLLQPYTLAAIAKATQVAVADQAHVFALCTIGCCGSTHRRFLRVICVEYMFLCGRPMLFNSASETVRSDHCSCHWCRPRRDRTHADGSASPGPAPGARWQGVRCCRCTAVRPG